MSAKLNAAAGQAQGDKTLASATFNTRLRFAALHMKRLHRSALRLARAPGRLLARIRLSAPDRLLIAPQDIRTADPTRAEEIYSGYFAFGGRIMTTQGRSPFEVAPPSDDWERTLRGFSWLRHLRAADTALARANARALIDDYLNARHAARLKIENTPMVVARRILSWLSQSPIILDGADGRFYHLFVRALARDALRLQQALPTMSGVDRLWAAIAIAEFAMCAQVSNRVQTRSSAQLSAEITAQILSDGGHIGRNPDTIIELLLDLLPLRQAYAARSFAPPQALITAIDRMLPMVRLLRHGDGALALFNGMGVTAPDRVAIVLAYDDARGAALLNAPQSGYQRLQSGDCVAIVDVGAPPPASFSCAAHASCLAFEYSLGADRIIVNCGTPALARANVRRAARLTAAHSTLNLDDTSSCRFARHAGLEKIAADQIIAGPRRVHVKRRDSEDGARLEADHDGYARQFGLIHTRRLNLSLSGRRLTGEDRLEAAKSGGKVKAQFFAVRFHLHPQISVVHGGGEVEVLLEAASGRRVAFSANGALIDIEESIFFAAPEGARATLQLVVRGEAKAGANVQWSFEQVDNY